MFRMTRLATFVAVAAASAAAQNPFTVGQRGAPRPEITISFDVDGQVAALRIDGNEVDVDETMIGSKPNVRLEPLTLLGMDGVAFRLVDHLDTAFAILWLEDSGLQLRFVKRSDRAWLGVDLRPIPEVLAEHLDLDAANTSIVVDVREDSPAARAGLTKHDLVIGVSGLNGANADAVRAAIAESKPGAKLRLTLLRRGTETEVIAELGREPGPSRYGYVPYLSELPTVGQLFRATENGFFAQGGNDWPTAATPGERPPEYVRYDDALGHYLRQLPRGSDYADVQKQLDAFQGTYVLPNDAVDLAKPRSGEDAKVRLDRLEEQLARIEELLKQLGGDRKDN